MQIISSSIHLELLQHHFTMYLLFALAFTTFVLRVHFTCMVVCGGASKLFVQLRIFTFDASVSQKSCFVLLLGPSHLLSSENFENVNIGSSWASPSTKGSCRHSSAKVTNNVVIYLTVPMQMIELWLNLWEIFGWQKFTKWIIIHQCIMWRETTTFWAVSSARTISKIINLCAIQNVELRVGLESEKNSNFEILFFFLDISIVLWDLWQKSYPSKTFQPRSISFELWGFYGK